MVFPDPPAVSVGVKWSRFVSVVKDALSWIARLAAKFLCCFPFIGAERRWTLIFGGLFIKL